MRFFIIIGIWIISSAVLVTAFEEFEDWYPKDAEIRKKKCDDEHRSKTDKPEYSKDDSLREYVLCVAKELNVYSKRTGLNLKRLTQLTFAKGHINLETSSKLIDTCNEQHKDEIQEKQRIFKTITCTMDEYHKILLNQTRNNSEL